MIGAPGVQAAISASDDVYKPGIHGDDWVILARQMIVDDTDIRIKTQVSGRKTDDGRPEIEL